LSRSPDQPGHPRLPCRQAQAAGARHQVDTALPRRTEIEEALREYQRLFDARISRGAGVLREGAGEALRVFAHFEPRLVGAVLDGSAGRHSSVCLHLFSGDAETVTGFLDERGIPYEQQSRPLRLTRDVQREFPAFVFSAGEIPVDVTVLPEELLRQAPLDRSGEKPMRRASLAMLEELLADAPPE
jgi:hypothetical protein